MIKTFSDDLEPIEVKLKDKDGNEIVKKAKFLTVKECKEISKIYNNLEDDKTGEKAFQVLQDQMSYIFGGKTEEYEIYSPKLIKDVLNYITQQIINPTIQVQEKQD